MMTVVGMLCSVACWALASGVSQIKKIKIWGKKVIT